jgi:uncharacterized protein YggE
MRNVLAIISVLVLATNTLAEPTVTGTPAELTSYLQPSPQTVRVTGRAELKVQADRATIQLKVTTVDKSLQAALKKNMAVRAQVKAALEKGGIPSDRIRGSQFSSTPNQSFFSDKVKSYKVENIIQVDVSGETQFQLVAGEIDQREELSYQGIRFERSDEAELKRKVISQACEAAVAKKQLFQEKLGLKLVPYSFTENFAGQMQTVMAGAAISNVAGREPSLAEGRDTSLTQFDQITYVAEITLECKVVNP